MRGMGNADEVASPADPTAASILAWISAAAGKPWFPARHAAATRSDRDALDEPLGQLRRAGLVQVAAWERGLGQGYILTSEGETALASGSAIPQAAAAQPSEPHPVLGETSEIDIRPASVLALDARPPLVVPILFAANLLWFFVGLAIALQNGHSVWQYLSEGDNEVLHRIGAVTGFDFLNGQWWRLLSSCFVHIGGLHLLCNMFALIMIGPLAELLWGRWRLLVIYLLSGIAGSCLAMALKPDALLAGASGAIWGVLMSLAAWFILFRPHLPTDVVVDSTRRLVIVIVLNAMFSFMPGISWQAHLGGGVAGFTAAGLLNAMRFGDRRRRAIALAFLVSLSLGCISLLVGAMYWGDAWSAYRLRVANDERRFEDERLRQARHNANADFNRDVIPLLNQLSPDHVIPAEEMAMYQLYRPGARRNPERVAEARAKLGALKAAADAAIHHLSGPPVGIEPIDQLRQRAKSFAEARARSFTLLMEMLNSPAIPDEDGWTAWNDARHTAEQMWKQFVRK